MTVRVHPFALACLVLAACFSDTDHCDPDQRYAFGLCYQIDAAASPADAASTADADPRFAHFSDVCTGDDSCAAPTDYCAKYPSDPTGYCTRTGCLTDLSICPDGWSCLDLSVYLAGLPAICLRP